MPIPPEDVAPPFSVGDWIVRPEDGSVSRDQRTRHLEPRVMAVLVYLAARPGRVLSKSELLEAVWGAVAIEEGALPQAIHAIRKAFGDEAKSPRFVETIPKRGYRLVAEVGQIVERASADASASGRTRRRALVSLAALAAVVLATALVSRHRTVEPTPDLPSRVVVLPFQNLGPPRLSFFADGLTEQLTSDLVDLGSLRVISRTSATAYSRAGKTIAEIGDELGIDYVLEGSVLWDGDSAAEQPRFRITVQLIRGSDDVHLWSNEYDREAGDIFSVHSEISERVSGALGIVLRPDQRRRITAVPTNDLAAYRAYLRGLDLRNQPFFSQNNLTEAIGTFERAVLLDPGFATAWGELSQVHSYFCFNATRPEHLRTHCPEAADPTALTPGTKPTAGQALARALELAPELPAVRLAEAFHLYRVRRDFDRSLATFRAITREFPSNAVGHRGLGFVLRRRGRIDEALLPLSESRALDPKTIKVVWALAETYRAVRDHKKADRYFGQAIDLAPEQMKFWKERSLNRLAWTGDYDAARAILESAPSGATNDLAAARIELDLTAGRDPEALNRWAQLDVERISDPDRFGLSWRLALALRRQSRQDQARSVALETLRVLQRLVPPCDHRTRLEVGSGSLGYIESVLGLSLALLEREEEARCFGDRAATTVELDGFSGPQRVEARAVIDLMLGDHEAAVERVVELLRRPYRLSLTGRLLSIDPIWEEIRDDPRIREAIRK